MIEAVVVGGGLAGCAVALALRDRGALVTVVEAERPGAGATGASAGMLAPQYEMEGPDTLFEWGVEARSRWPAFAARLASSAGGGPATAADGMLVANLSAEEDRAARETAGRHRSRGLRAEVVGVDEARGLQPGLGLEAKSFLWLPDERAVDAQRLPELLVEGLEAAGVRLVAGNPVRAVRSEGGRVAGVIMADGRDLSADRVVLAVGARSGEVEGVPRSVPVRPVKGELMRYRLGDSSLRRIVATHDAAYLVPRPGGMAVAGSTMEEAGFDRRISEEARRSVHDRLSRVVTALEGREPREQWAGLRPVPEDGRPVLGPEPELEGLLYATGYGRNGILLAPVAGRAVAEHALEGDADVDLEAFRPDRFDAGG